MILGHAQTYAQNAYIDSMEPEHKFDLGDLVASSSDLSARMEVLAIRDDEAYCRREIDRQEKWYPVKNLRRYNLDDIPPPIYVG